MRDKPIIFSAPMVLALLDGRKTQTRRVVKDRGHLPEFCGGRHDDKNDPEVWGWEDHERGEWITLDQWRRWNFVPYRSGDRLYVREAWRVGAWHYNNSGIAVDYCDGPRKEWLGVDDSDMLHRLIDQSRAEAKKIGRALRDGYYEYSWSPGGSPCRWRPSIHMPRWASRLTLTVTDVRVQRLQEISEADAWKEGCKPGENNDRGEPFPADEPHPSGGEIGWECARDWFADLWTSLHGPDAWDANPWVVCLSFETHRCNIDQMEEARAGGE